MPNSTNLGLPFMDANQNQKYVTYNDALLMLDALVQIEVQSAALTAPPGSPSDGQVWIVGAGATGAWAGKDLNLAAWQDGVWNFYPPKPGYIAFNVATGQSIMWNGTAWGSLLSTATPIPVSQGGTGQTSLSAHGVLVGEGTTGVAQVASGSGGTVLQGAASADPSFTANPTLGIAGSLSGSLTLANASGGSTKLQPQTPASGTLTLPAAIDTLVGRTTTDTLTNKTLTAPAISGGTIDNAAIGGGTPAAGAFTDVGIGTAADPSNPLSVTANTALFNALLAAGGGTGDYRIKLNKGSSSNTASFLFQDGFSGRAEIGLTGDDNFHFKVSPDGSTWHDGIIIDKSTGAVTLGNGRTAVSDANYAALATDRLVAYTALTAARTLTLPAASSFPAGGTLVIADESGSCSATKTITVARAGSDTIDSPGGGAATSAVLASAYAGLVLICNGSNKWTVLAQTRSPNTTSTFLGNATSNAFNTGGNPANLHMLGFGVSFTPRGSGTCLCFLQGQVSSSQTTDTMDFRLYYGTGSAPANGAAQTGTAATADGVVYQAAAPDLAQVLLVGVVNLTPGTAYWFDAAMGSRNAAATTTTFFNPGVVIIELS